MNTKSMMSKTWGNPLSNKLICHHYWRIINYMQKFLHTFKTSILKMHNKCIKSHCLIYTVCVCSHNIHLKESICGEKPHSWSKRNRVWILQRWYYPINVMIFRFESVFCYSGELWISPKLNKIYLETHTN